MRKEKLEENTDAPPRCESLPVFRDMLIGHLLLNQKLHPLFLHAESAALQLKTEGCPSRFEKKVYAFQEKKQADFAGIHQGLK